MKKNEFKERNFFRFVFNIENIKLYEIVSSGFFSIDITIKRELNIVFFWNVYNFFMAPQ